MPVSHHDATTGPDSINANTAPARETTFEAQGGLSWFTWQACTTGLAEGVLCATSRFSPPDTEDGDAVRGGPLRTPSIS